MLASIVPAALYITPLIELYSTSCLQDFSTFNTFHFIIAVDYPFYGVQWHPELSIFEFNINAGLGKHINHSGNAVLSAQAFAMFFVNEARKSEHRFPNKKLEEQYLIYNYESYHAGIHGWFDEQIYIF